MSVVDAISVVIEPGWCCRDDASDANNLVDERASTYRLLEPVAHPSRAEDLVDLHRLQKSSTKPRRGKEALCGEQGLPPANQADIWVESTANMARFPGR